MPLPGNDPREPAQSVAELPGCALLAVDAGLRAGLAAYSRQGRLLWQRSLHLADIAALKRYVRGLLHELPELQVLVLEGGGAVARVWENAAAKRGLRLLICSAEEWRAELLHPREQRSGADAKNTALRLARKVMARSGLPRPASLRHDAAEAVLAGFFALRRLGWERGKAEDVLR